MGLTAGNPESQAKVLETQGYLAARRALSTSGFQVRYQITESGARAFREYLASLQIFLEEVGR